MPIARTRGHIPRVIVSDTGRSPLHDPVYGDVVEGADGERRSVELQERIAGTVHYRRAGGDAVDEHGASQECSLADWRRWSSDGCVLHAAHKPALPPMKRRMHASDWKPRSTSVRRSEVSRAH